MNLYLANLSVIIALRLNSKVILLIKYGLFALIFIAGYLIRLFRDDFFNDIQALGVSFLHSVCWYLAIHSRWHDVSLIRDGKSVPMSIIVLVEVLLICRIDFIYVALIS